MAEIGHAYGTAEGGTERTAEETGRAKLKTPFEIPNAVTMEFLDLPAERNDMLWSEIRDEYKLTIPELSALKNARCQGVSALVMSNSRRGVGPGECGE